MENVRKYFKRDISWLSFNYRVLMEAMDHTVPLFDRIKFLSIYQSNLEEFYRVRVSEYHQILSDPLQSIEDKRQAENTLSAINQEVNRQVDIFNKFFFNEIIPELEKEGMVLYHNEQIENCHREEIRNFFKEEVFPFLQPVLILKNDIVSFLRDNRLYWHSLFFSFLRACEPHRRCSLPLWLLWKNLHRERLLSHSENR